MKISNINHKQLSLSKNNAAMLYFKHSSTIKYKCLALVFTVSLIFSYESIKAAVNTYSFAQATGTYTALAASGNTTLCAGNGAGTSSTPYPSRAIGFNFVFDCNTYTSLGIHTNGFVWFGTGTPSNAGLAPIGSASANIGGTGTINGIIAAYGGYVATMQAGAAGSYIRTSLVGSSPNRIFKIEWRGYRVTGGSGNGTLPAYQLWLYETTNVIEQYVANQGALFIATSVQGQIGIRGTANTDVRCLNTPAVTNTTWNIPASTTVATSTVFIDGISVARYCGVIRKWTWTPTGSCCTPPTTAATGFISTNITTSSCDISFTRGNGTGGVLVVARATATTQVAPTIGTSYATPSLVFGAGTLIGTGNFAVYNGTGNGISALTTTITITGLSPFTGYSFDIYEYEVTSNCYKTPALIGTITTASCAPTIQPSSPTIACLSQTAFYLKFTRGNGNRVIVLARAGSAVNADPVYNTSYTSNATFGSGTQIGTGNFVVYDGNAAGVINVQLSGLLAGTTYFFKMYEYNSAPNCYNTSAPTSISGTTLGGAYVSSTTTQNTSSVAQGALAQDIVKLTIVTGGNVNQAVFLNSITFTTTGTTNATNDLTNAKIFYTGSSNAFSNATQFGATFTSFAGSLVANSNFALLNGNNYFWIAYDVKSTATGGNFLDATVTSINISENGITSNKTPTITAPAGNRQIPGAVTCSIATPVAAACAFTGCITACCQGMTILSANFNTALGSFPCNAASNGNGYNDVTATHSFTVNEGATYPLSFNFDDWIGLDFRWAVWIDWNGNNDFRDAGERFPSGTATNALGASQNITIPANCALSGVKMRLWIQSDLYPNDCPYRTTCGIFSTSLGYIADIAISIPNATGVIIGGPGPVSCATSSPVVSSPITYTQNDVPSQLAATGTNLLWYTAATGGVGTTLAPTPSTALAGTTAYYVSQTNSVGLPVCEGPRTQIAVKVNALPLNPPVAAVLSQPTCAVPTGSIQLTNLPASGAWTINPNGINGSGASNTINNVVSGTYNYTVTDAFGCISSSSNSVVINTPPVGTPGLWIGGVSTDWNDVNNWCSALPTSTTDVTIPNGTTFSPIISSTGIAYSRSLTIDIGATLTIASSGDLRLYGNLIVNGSYINTAAPGLLELVGSSNQTIAGITASDVLVNNNSGVTITGDLIVKNNLNLSNGIISTGSFMVEVQNANANAITGGSNNSYIASKLKRAVNLAGPYNYPVGDASNYTPYSIAFTNNTPLGLASNILVNVIPSVHPNNGTSPNFINRYWAVTPTNIPAGTLYDVNYTYANADVVGVEANIFPAKYNSGGWLLPNGSGALNVMGVGGVTPGINTLNWTGLSTFSDFTGNGNGSPLPISLLDFNAYPIMQNVNIEWTTLSETNNDFFSIEKSKNGFNFNLLDQVKGAGNSNSQKKYQYFDYDPFDGISYYRLKQTDFDGHFIYSEIKPVSFLKETVNNAFQIYPNPSTLNGIYLTNYQSCLPCEIKINDITGRLIFEQSINNTDESDVEFIKIEGAEKGTYFLQIKNGASLEVFKVILD